MFSYDCPSLRPKDQSGVRKITYKGTEQNIDEADKQLCNEEPLPEIHRVSHLSQEGDEEKSTTVAVYSPV